jgi:hypothetical protein
VELESNGAAASALVKEEQGSDDAASLDPT